MDKGSLTYRWFGFLAALIIAIWPNAGYAQRVTMEIDTALLAIGDQAILTIHADRDIDAGSGVFGWPDWTDTIPGGLEIITPLGIDTVAMEGQGRNGTIRISSRWLVTHWDSGYHAIPPAALLFRNDTILSNPILLEVLLPPPGEPGQIAGHADIRRTQWTWKERLMQAMPWAMGLLGTALLAALALRLWRNREPAEEKQVIEVPTPKDPAHVVAFRKLEALEKASIWKQGQTKEHYAQASTILREYLENRFEFPALERSSSEIKSGLQSLPLRQEESDVVMEVLQLTDLVKFAKWTPNNQDHLRIIQRCIRFVELTVPEPATHQEFNS